MKLIKMIDADDSELTETTVEVPDSMEAEYANATYICTDVGALLNAYPFDDEED